MREKDRELSRRRHRRIKRLKRRNQEEIQHRTERPAGSKRSIKKAPPAPAEATQGSPGPAEAPPSEAPKKQAPAKKAPAKKAPAKKAVPAPVPAPEGEGGEPGPEEPQAG